jgi:hypothetical protein
MKASEVNKKNETILFQAVYKYVKYVKPKDKEGKKAIISKLNDAFGKGYTGNRSTEVFQSNKVFYSNRDT